MVRVSLDFSRIQ